MERKNKFAILAIGTEVTSGQIVNKNTALMSSWMEELGFETVVHMAVPDDHDLMIDGLKKCSEHAEFVFTCGGLGPTSDDFTRHVIAEFLGCELEFDQVSHNKIQEKMKIMGRVFLESQKQQCYFPKGSTILWNSAGTANGFFLDAGQFKIAVFPGPPNEVTAIWNDGLAEVIKKYSSKDQKAILRRWNCMGRPEAELAEVVEEIVKGSRLKIGYRLNAPYVEIKLWCDPGELVSSKKYFDGVEAKLGQWIVLRDDEDPWEEFWSAIGKFESVAVIDEASEGILCTRLADRYRSVVTREHDRRLLLLTGKIDTSPSAELVVHAGPLTAKGEFELIVEAGNRKKEYSLRSPFHHNLLNDRSRLAAAELTVLSVNQFLSEK